MELGQGKKAFQKRFQESFKMQERGTVKQSTDMEATQVEPKRKNQEQLKEEQKRSDVELATGRTGTELNDRKNIVVQVEKKQKRQEEPLQASSQTQVEVAGKPKKQKKKKKEQEERRSQVSHVVSEKNVSSKETLPQAEVEKVTEEHRKQEKGLEGSIAKSEDQEREERESDQEITSHNLEDEEELRHLKEILFQYRTQVKGIQLQYSRRKEELAKARMGMNEPGDASSQAGGRHRKNEETPKTNIHVKESRHVLSQIGEQRGNWKEEWSTTMMRMQQEHFHTGGRNVVNEPEPSKAKIGIKETSSVGSYTGEINANKEKEPSTTNVSITDARNSSSQTWEINVGNKVEPSKTKAIKKETKDIPLHTSGRNVGNEVEPPNHKANMKETRDLTPQASGRNVSNEVEASKAKMSMKENSNISSQTREIMVNDAVEASKAKTVMKETRDLRPQTSGRNVDNEEEPPKTKTVMEENSNMSSQTRAIMANDAVEPPKTKTVMKENSNISSQTREIMVNDEVEPPKTKTVMKEARDIRLHTGERNVNNEVEASKAKMSMKENSNMSSQTREIMVNDAVVPPKTKTVMKENSNISFQTREIMVNDAVEASKAKTVMKETRDLRPQTSGRNVDNEVEASKAKMSTKDNSNIISQTRETIVNNDVVLPKTKTVMKEAMYVRPHKGERNVNSEVEPSNVEMSMKEESAIRTKATKEKQKLQFAPFQSMKDTQELVQELPQTRIKGGVEAKYEASTRIQGSDSPKEDRKTKLLEHSHVETERQLKSSKQPIRSKAEQKPQMRDDTGAQAMTPLQDEGTGALPSGKQNNEFEPQVEKAMEDKRRGNQESSQTGASQAKHEVAGRTLGKDSQKQVDEKGREQGEMETEKQFNSSEKPPNKSADPSNEIQQHHRVSDEQVVTVMESFEAPLTEEGSLQSEQQNQELEPKVTKTSRTEIPLPTNVTNRFSISSESSITIDANTAKKLDEKEGACPIPLRNASHMINCVEFYRWLCRNGAGATPQEVMEKSSHASEMEKSRNVTESKPEVPQRGEPGRIPPYFRKIEKPRTEPEAVTTDEKPRFLSHSRPLRSTDDTEVHLLTQEDKTFASKSLAVHNSFRAKHGVPPLKLNLKMCGEAKKRAKHLCDLERLDHRLHRKYGENIYRTRTTDDNFNVTPHTPIEKWYAEIRHHNFGHELSGNLPSGHFTQVVWKETEELGVAREKSKNGYVVVVAFYFPQGNVVEKFAENVPPPMKFNSLNLEIRSPRSSNSKTRVSFALEEGLSDDVFADGSPEILGSDGEINGSPAWKLGDWYLNTPFCTCYLTLKFLHQEAQGLTQDDATFAFQSLKAHNMYRAKHGVPTLELNIQMCGEAKEWMEHLRDLERLEHRLHWKYGENIYFVRSTGNNFTVTPHESVKKWYSEIQRHQFGHEPSGHLSSVASATDDLKRDIDKWVSADANGHFTQVVWKDTKELGVAHGKSKNGDIIVVAFYFPQGNFAKKFTENPDVDLDYIQLLVELHFRASPDSQEHPSDDVMANDPPEIHESNRELHDRPASKLIE
ncbi:unnamed protein product [Darwinula stevensoni]|uniref:SCP domain-containing protein n=1 Tax=Darwinula stevensoni TaxID=69355 RepID=A0A7R8X9C6_9CRUS|nr:unnamed protein product [Darwinula stevensoni]CAG0882411.1 unnamed protein product [Darwinula stevensoni]